ncbi:MAG TPA: GGDEF domain-containing protein [Symbiobacteriaceae bacterium]|nr:GGDEF domain-containing protein [Symbiobacteriaceae bacterium]
MSGYAFHETTAMVAVLVAAFVGYVAYRSYQKDGSESLAYLALAHMGFAILYAPHALLTRTSDHHLILFLAYGPASRLTMAAYLLAGLLRLNRRSGRRLDLRPHLLLLACAAVALGLLATSEVGLQRYHLRLVDGAAVFLSLSGILATLAVRVRSALLSAHLMAQVFFVQGSLAFLLSTPWTGLWWLAHAISAAGFTLLGYHIVISHWRGLAFDCIYDETVLYGLLDRMMESSSIGFFLTDGSFTPVRINHTAELVLGAGGGRPVDGVRLLALMGLSREALAHRPAEQAASFQCDVAGRPRYYEARVAPVEPAHPERGWLCVLIDTTEAHQAREEIRHIALHDTLTGLPNRLLLYDRLDMALSLARRHGRAAGVLMLDLDGFKAVNDRYGHDAGDEVLRTVAVRLRESLRDSDTAGRLAGDEFVVVLTELACAADAGAVAEKLLARIAEPIWFEGQQLQVTASIGIVVHAEGEISKHRLLKQADTAMYEAKARGRNACVFHETV